MTYYEQLATLIKAGHSEKDARKYCYVDFMRYYFIAKKQEIEQLEMLGTGARLGQADNKSYTSAMTKLKSEMSKIEHQYKGLLNRKVETNTDFRLPPGMAFERVSPKKKIKARLKL